MIGLITTTAVIIIMYILLKIIDITPYTRMFIVGLTISLVLLRLLWVFYSQLIFNLFVGYELDRTLTLRKSEKNILQLIGCGKLSNKILATTDDDNGADLSMYDIRKKVDVETGGPSSNNNNSNINFKSLKGMEKYAKLKNREELLHEINRVKEEAQHKQMELACLENMMFASEQDNSNSKQNSQSKNSQNESELQLNPNRYSVESGVLQSFKQGNASPLMSEDHGEANDEQMDLETNLQSTAPSQLNSEYQRDHTTSRNYPGVVV